MFGSDWPVCLLAATYNQVVTTAETLTATLTPPQQEAIFTTTATRTYNL
jgi:L-fuconolactonase